MAETDTQSNAITTEDFSTKPNKETISFPSNILRRSDIEQFTYLAVHDNVDAFNKITSEKKPLIFFFLPLPRDIGTSYRANWQTEDLGIVGTEGVVGAGLSLVANTMFPSAGSSAAQKYIKSRFKNVANPYRNITFTGHDLRTFQFTWDLVSTSDTEADVLNETLFYIKKMIHSPSPNDAPALTNPPLWNIQIVHKQGTKPNDGGLFTQVPAGFGPNKYLFNLKSCAVTDVSIDYTSKGLAFHKTGSSGTGTHAPVSVRLTISFTETTINTQEQFVAIGNTV